DARGVHGLGRADRSQAGDGLEEVDDAGASQDGVLAAGCLELADDGTEGRLAILEAAADVGSPDAGLGSLLEGGGAGFGGQGGQGHGFLQIEAKVREPTPPRAACPGWCRVLGGKSNRPSTGCT